MFNRILKYVIRQLKKTFSKAYVISLIIAILLWALIKFSALYQDRVTFQVKLNHLPNTYILLNNSSQQVNCVVKTTGFRILLLKYWLSETMEIDFKDLTRFNETEYRFNLEESSRASHPRWLNHAQEVIYENAEIQFNIEQLLLKKVKIEPKINLGFKQGYILDAIHLNHDSIEVLLPKSLSNVDQVYTYEKNALELSASTQIELFINLPKSWKLVGEPIKIESEILVDQLTEGVFNLPIQKENGVDIKYFPSRVEVKYSIPSKEFNTITPDDIVIDVDYSFVENQQNKALKVNVVSKPKNAQILSISPAEVEFLIFDNE